MNKCDGLDVCLHLSEMWERYKKGAICGYFLDGIEMTHWMILKSRLDRINWMLYTNFNLNGMMIGNTIVVAINKKGGSCRNKQTSIWYEVSLNPPDLDNIAKWYIELTIKRGGNSPRSKGERHKFIENLTNLCEEMEDCLKYFFMQKQKKKRTRSQIGEKCSRIPRRRQSQLILPLPIEDLSSSERTSSFQLKNPPSLLFSSQPSFPSNMMTRFSGKRKLTPRYRSNSQPIRKERQKRVLASEILRKPRANSQPPIYVPDFMKFEFDQTNY